MPTACKRIERERQVAERPDPQRIVVVLAPHEQRLAAREALVGRDDLGVDLRQIAGRNVADLLLAQLDRERTAFTVVDEPEHVGALDPAAAAVLGLDRIGTGECTLAPVQLRGDVAHELAKWVGYCERLLHHHCLHIRVPVRM